jgi:hypothetical protein
VADDPYSYAPPPSPRTDGRERSEGVAEPDAASDAPAGLEIGAGVHVIEIEATGPVTITGELRSIRVTPRDQPPR